MRRLTRPLVTHLARALLVTVVAGPALAVGGCSSSGSRSTAPPDRPAPTTTSPSSAAAEGTAITIKGFAFQPVELRAKVGDTITVTNADGTEHSLTAVDGSFGTGRFSSATRTVTVTQTGRLEFKCEVHSFMPHGFIQVSG